MEKQANGRGRTGTGAGAAGLAVAAMLAGAAAPARAIPTTAHPDWPIKQVPLEKKYKTMGLAFLKDGRLALATTEAIGGGEVPSKDPKHAVFIISDPGGAAPTVKEVANTWHQPAGLVAVENKLYVSDRDGFYEILDLEAPSDLKANRKLIVKWPDEQKWGTFGFQWHQWVFTPMHKDGWFYGPYSGSIVMGGPSDTKPTSSFSGAFLKWNLAGTMEKFAGGLRSPNGAGINPAGEMFVADNQGSWLPSSTFMHMKPNKFYGHSNTSPGNPNQKNWAEDLPYERPVAWLPQGELRTSPGQPVWIPSGPYQGDWLLGDCAHDGLVRIALDDVGGTYNGSVFWFGQGFGRAAINRMAFGPDGSLYVGTLTQGGNWPGGDLQPLYRLTPSATPTAFDMRKVASVQGGVEIHFTDPVDKATATAAAFPVRQWKYVRTHQYGGDKQGTKDLPVSEVQVSADGKRVFLALAGVTEDHVVHIKAVGVKSQAGKSLWNDQAWFTLSKQRTTAFDPTTAVARAPSAYSRLEGLVRHRHLVSGLEVSVEADGAHAVTLRALDGSLLAAAEGAGRARHVLRSAGAGLQVLEVRRGQDVLRRTVAAGR